jgi:hypothetical protein
MKKIVLKEWLFLIAELLVKKYKVRLIILYIKQMKEKKENYNYRVRFSALSAASYLAKGGDEVVFEKKCYHWWKSKTIEKRWFYI